MIKNDFNTLDSRYSDVTKELLDLTELCRENNKIEAELYTKYSVNRGLRDLNGNGVLTGLTEISEIQAFKKINGEKVACEGELYYRGYNVEDLVGGFINESRYGFEEVTYLLIFGNLPKEDELKNFQNLLAKYRTLPTSFVRDIIMKAPSSDMMNTLARSVLTLHAYDSKANDVELSNVLRQCLLLIAVFPMLAVYGYQSYKHYHEGDSFFIHAPQPELSTAENILYTLRQDTKYSKLEAKILDIAMILHAEHGGGNNSTFTTHVVTSSGTDTYSAISAAIGSLKGPKHGGANIKVVQMFEDLKKNVSSWEDEDSIREYLTKLLRKEAFDKAGLIYGMGHAIYTLSDPRANIFKRYVENLSQEKGRTEEFMLYSTVERLAADVIGKERKIYKGVSANVDFYSGFVYNMLDLPVELFTPIFAIARITGWSAHRLEELINSGKIIRPAYMNVAEREEYIPINNR